jgi:hypothetical protein
MAKDLKGQLGTFLKMGLEGVSKVSEVVVEKSKQGKLQLDLTLLRRKRRDALADLGEVVLRLCEAGKLDEGQFPELSGPLATIESFDERIAAAKGDLDTEEK